MTRVHLHIGANKTGTTALQNVLAGSDALLRENGLLYPRAGRGRFGEGGTSHTGLASALGFDPARRPMSGANELIDALHAEIAASGCGEVVLSSEFFMLRRNIAPVAECLARYDTRVVVFLRHHEEWLQSLVKQALLTVDDIPWDLTVEGYIAHQDRVQGQYIDYDALLDDWSQHFGKKNVVVRSYERYAGAPDVATNFLQAVGRDDIARQLTPSPVLNESLPFDALKFIRRIRKAPLPAPLRLALIRVIERGAKGASGRATLTPEVQAEVRRRFEPQYARIAQEYLARSDGRLFMHAKASAKAQFGGEEQPSMLRNAAYVLRGAARTSMAVGSFGGKRSH